MARKYGMRSGYVEAINHAAGTVEVDGGSASVDFDEAMENAPAVVLTPAQDATSAYVPAGTTTETGFTVEGDDGVYHYVAVDESRY